MLAFGEVLFDLINNDAHLGGASLNVAAHFAKHGNEAFLISAVGNDLLGEKVRQVVNSYGVNTSFIQENNHPTGIVNVTLSEQGQPSYDIVENVAWDYIDIQEKDFKFIESCAWDCFYFGMLAQRSIHNQITLDKLFQAAQFPIIFFDVNLRKDYFNEELLRKSFKRCTILKLNDEEVEVLSPLLFNASLTISEFAERCAREFSIAIVIVTLGANGAGFYSEGNYLQVPGVKVKVADTVGAGDSFSAAFLNTYLQGGTIEDAVKAGCKLGAYVASKNGAVPEYRGNL